VSNVLSFQVVAAASAPHINSVSPSPVTGSASSQTISINGTGFINKPTVTVTWTGGSKVLTSAEVVFYSATLLQMTINTSTLADTWSVTASSPANLVSNVLSFQVVAAASAP